MDPGMTESQVRTELGAPHAAVDTGKGTQRWVYSMQPFGQEVWWIEFDADGRIVRREEVLDRAHMALIKPGVSTEKDVWPGCTDSRTTVFSTWPAGFSSTSTAS